MRRYLPLFAASLFLIASHAPASTLTVTESGSFDPATPVTAFSTPGGTFLYSFAISSTPVASSVSLGNYFNADPSSFTYTLNGVTSSPTVSSITFFSAADGGLLDICFISACNGDVTPDTGFEFVGPQLYTGSEANPTILPGTYQPTDAGFYSSGNFTELASASPVVIAATPEPSNVALLGTGLFAIGGLVRRRRA